MAIEPCTFVVAFRYTNKRTPFTTYGGEDTDIARKPKPVRDDRRRG